MQLKKNSVSNKKDTSSVQKIDWLSWGILISATVIVAFFLFSEIGYYLIEQKLQKQNMERQANLMEFNYNVQSGKSTPQKTYEQLRQALLNNNLEGALETIYPGYLWKYEDNLTAAYNDDNLSVFLERLTPLQEKIYDDGWTTVSYALENLPNNNSPNPLENFSREVEFIRNNKGIWKISSI